jgi:HSP20 family protein
MALIRWEPLPELTTIQNEMNRLFNTAFDQPGQASRAGATRRWIPAMDLIETDDHYVLRADLPGLSESDISIELESNVLTVSGERRLDHEEHAQGYHRIERAFGSFARSLTLPEGVNADAVNASVEHGVLKILIPKPEERKPRKVTITPGASQPDVQTIDSTATAAATHTNSGDPIGSAA